jgi:hypothetical protein
VDDEIDVRGLGVGEENVEDVHEVRQPKVLADVGIADVGQPMERHAFAAP